MQDDIPVEYKLLTTDNGEQVPVMLGEGIALAHFSIGTDKLASETVLDINEAEFNDLQKLAETNSIPDDTIKAKELI